MSKSDSTLTIERLREVLDYCPASGLFIRKIRTSPRVPAGSVAGGLTAKGYVAIRVDNKRYFAHRLAFFWVTGEISKAFAIDHKDRNRSNNSFLNLREASRSQNGQNANLSNASSSGHKGVSWHSTQERWHAHIILQGKSLHLGSFFAIEDAIAARQKAEILHHPFRATDPSTSPSCSS